MLEAVTGHHTDGEVNTVAVSRLQNVHRMQDVACRQ